MATNNAINNGINQTSHFYTMNTLVQSNEANSENSPYIVSRKSRVGGVITTADYLGTIAFQGFDGAAYQIGAQILCRSTGTIAAGKIPANLAFYTKPDTAGALAERMVISASGAITINAPTSGTALTCTASDVRARTFFATGDEATGVVSQTAITNVTNVAANSTGVFTIKSKSATAADSVGFIKIWVGTTAYWVPYFSNPAP